MLNLDGFIEITLMPAKSGTTFSFLKTPHIGFSNGFTITVTGSDATSALFTAYSFTSCARVSPKPSTVKPDVQIVSTIIR